MRIDLNEIKKYDYSDTSTARELIYKLTEELQKAYKLQDDLMKHEIIFKKELDISKKKLKTIDDMVHFIKNLDNEFIDNNDSNEIIKSMEHISEKMEENCDLINAKKNKWGNYYWYYFYHLKIKNLCHFIYRVYAVINRL